MPIQPRDPERLLRLIDRLKTLMAEQPLDWRFTVDDFSDLGMIYAIVSQTQGAEREPRKG